MSSETSNASEPKLDLAKWANLPNKLMLGGGIFLLIGFLLPGWRDQFYYSYLTGFMFFLSLMLGSLFLVLLHHLFDAYWLVPIRRFLEHIACLAPDNGTAFSTHSDFSSQSIYPWMTIDPHTDHALHVKVALFNIPAFWITSILLFVIWWWLGNSLRKQSLGQDETGAASHTHVLRKLAAPGVIIFAVTLTLGVIFWMKSLEHQWFSTMYGVYYFRG
jgi:hypothetical protein